MSDYIKAFNAEYKAIRGGQPEEPDSTLEERLDWFLDTATDVGSHRADAYTVMGRATRLQALLNMYTQSVRQQGEHTPMVDVDGQLYPLFEETGLILVGDGQELVAAGMSNCLPEGADTRSTAPVLAGAARRLAVAATVISNDPAVTLMRKFNRTRDAASSQQQRNAAMRSPFGPLGFSSAEIDGERIDIGVYGSTFNRGVQSTLEKVHMLAPGSRSPEEPRVFGGLRDQLVAESVLRFLEKDSSAGVNNIEPITINSVVTESVHLMSKHVGVH